MAFTSDLGGSLIIDDSNYTAVVGDGYVDGQQMGRGYVARDYSANPFGSYAPTFNSSTLIPRSEWADRIQHQEETKSTLTHLHAHYKLPVLNQKRTNFCWCFGVVGAISVARAKAGLSTEHLSAAATAARIKNYANVGGWGGQALEGIEKWGVPTIEHWPEAVIDRRYDTPAMRADSERRKILEWTELPEQSFDALVTQLLLGIPTSMALMWWGHLVFGLRAVVIERGHFGVEIMNSWDKTWGNGGKSILAENKATPHEAISVRAVSAVNG
jgi:hypothetical protein